MWRTDSFEKTLMLVVIKGRRKRGQQRMRWLDGITNLMDMSLVSSRSRWWTGMPGVLQSIGSQRVRHDWVTELNWTKRFTVYFCKGRQKEGGNLGRVRMVIMYFFFFNMRFPGGSDSKESACNAGDLGSIPGLGRSPGGWHGNPLQYSWPGEFPWTEEPVGLQSMVS